MGRNNGLQAAYETQHADGYWAHHSRGARLSESVDAVVDVLDDMGLLKGGTFLDVGCGQGKLVLRLIAEGAESALGIDYAAQAIMSARALGSGFDGAEFQMLTLDSAAKQFSDRFDVVTSLGTLEHMDDPVQALRQLRSMAKPGGYVVTTSPHFWNIRGIVWMTLLRLLRVPMSKTDIHYFSPVDMKRMSEQAGLDLQAVTEFDEDWGNGVLMIEDLTDRLPKALKQAGFPVEGVPDLMRWLTDLSENAGIIGEGATACYVMQRD